MELSEFEERCAPEFCILKLAARKDQKALMITDGRKRVSSFNLEIRKVTVAKTE